MTPELLNEAAKRVFAQCVPNYETECIVWTGRWTTQNGYGRVTFKRRKHLTHRIVYQARKGPVPDGLQILHSCDNRRCCNPNHLSLGTGQDNTNDRKAKDRLGFKLNTAQAREILALVRSGRKQPEVAKMFGINASMVSRIASGKKWAHVHNSGGTDSASSSSLDSVY
jgi:hypothetical protein